jgi:hypothetical protein
MIEQPEKNIDRNKAPGEWLAGWPKTQSLSQQFLIVLQNTQ